METFFITFDTNDLPKWAQKCPEVLERAKVDLAFRCNVHIATHRDYRNFLKRCAQDWVQQRRQNM